MNDVNFSKVANKGNFVNFWQMFWTVIKNLNLNLYKHQCIGKRTFTTPNRNHTPFPKTKLLPKSLVQKSQKLNKPGVAGVLTVNIIPSSHNSAKIAMFSCQKNEVPMTK